jgi:hypothetical protein
MGTNRSEILRSSKEFKDLVNMIRAKYIMAGRKPPTTSRITGIIARCVRKSDILKNEFIKF